MASYKQFTGSSTTLTASARFELVQQSPASTMIPFLYPYYQFLACLVALDVMYLIVSSFLGNLQTPSEIRALLR